MLVHILDRNPYFPFNMSPLPDSKYLEGKDFYLGHLCIPIPKTHRLFSRYQMERWMDGWMSP